MNENQTETHDSYGMLSFSRTSRGAETFLFGSSIGHRETITLRIAPGSVKRKLNQDWYHLGDGAPFIEVEMSQSQFAESITSMNQGAGVPVTLRRLNGKGVEELDFVNKRIQFEREFEKNMQKLQEKMSALVVNTEDILTKKTINKSDKDTILKEILWLKSELASNMPFVFSQFNEQMDRTVTEAKAEVEAFTINKLNALGLEKLEDLKLLQTEKNENILLSEHKEK